ncbi:S-layer homology domain-containing protein [filamentous cyanobacterium LEGE 11480]|uniref:S-layer homology domain-containing protein n=1 Tax=Romeriopsis navalis LEGE 11480 TaxID=2777977 RepID=A0A928VSQ8_9CYAN|nr:S-layer homology domain-containing protein [Romeriopsis navalis]MBE9033053.1 S-layer homology domain-containing protein [Romeriopsis navalis LEGE 11480]
MFRSLQTSTALAMTLGMSAIAIAPAMMATPAQAQTNFNDVSSSYWANDFIQSLSSRGVIAGFPDGSFRPNDLVTRAQFASMVSGAFSTPNVRSAVSFPDVASSYWGANAISNAYQKGFMSGYPNGTFNPNQNIPRVQSLVALANGLGHSPNGDVNSILNYYNDSSSIPSYARSSVAAATNKGMVVNYPNLTQLNPNRSMTRAEAAAFIYQALRSKGTVGQIASSYIVSGTPVAAAQVKIPSGTVLPVKYDKADKILLGKNEPVPSNIAMTIPQNIVNSAGKILIPTGSTVEGKLVVDDGAAQFMAERLIMTNGDRYDLNAVSEKITTTETIRKGASATGVIKGTVLGAAAAAGITAVTGDRNINAWETLAGAGAGALAGLIFSKDKVELISVQPNTDLAIQLKSELVLPQ